MRLSFILPLASTFSYGLRPGYATANVSAFALSSSGRQELIDTRKIVRKMSANSTESPTDPEYPGTAVQRMLNVRARVAELAQSDALNQKWEDVRRKLLWAGGLRDLPHAKPGEGYTGHSFNDFNHVDLTCMMPVDSQNKGEIEGIATGNFLGKGIRAASLPEVGPGGSWSTCAMGCNKDPPIDVAHIQFKSRIAYKLVWVPNDHYDTFVLVDDDGKLLAKGKPSDAPDGLPSLRERKLNYQIVAGSKYATAAEAISRSSDDTAKEQ